MCKGPRAGGTTAQVERLLFGVLESARGPWQPEGRTDNVHSSWKCSVDVGVLGLKKEGSP